MKPANSPRQNVVAVPLSKSSRHLRNRLAAPLAVISMAILGATFAEPTASAQTVTFANAQTVLATSIPNSEFQGVAVDASGNLYVTNDYSFPGEVYEVLAIDGVISPNPATNTLGSGFEIPLGIAVDASGNVYVADFGANEVKEILAVDGVIPASPTIRALGSGFNGPSGVAVDTAGNVYVADANSFEYKEIMAVDGVIPAKPTIRILYSVPQGVFDSPQGVAVDASGNVYLAEYSSETNGIKEILAVDGVIPANPTIRILGSGFLQPNDVAVDALGNVYVADEAAVKEILAVDGVIPANPTIDILSVGGASAVAVDAKGNIFVPAGGGEIVELQTQSANFGTCGTNNNCAYSLGLTYNVAANTTIRAVKILTQGVAGRDFQAGPSYLYPNPCSAQTYTAATTCTVAVIFQALFAGARNGAVQILDKNGDILATTPVYGIDSASQIAFTPAPQVTLSGGFLQPFQLAVDGLGNVFVADFGNSRVVKVPPGGPPTTVGTGLYGPQGVALDGAANIYIADTNHNRVVEVPAGGGAQITLPFSGLSTPLGLAVDQAGDVFVADYLNSRVVELPANGGPQTTVGSGLSEPRAVAVDFAGNVFISDFGLGEIVEVPAGGGKQISLGDEFDSPYELAVDGAGNLYVTDYADNRIQMIPAGGGTPITVGEFPLPAGVALDSAGDLFVAENNSGLVVELLRSQPPSLSFAPTNVGSSSTPQTVQIQNIGYSANLTGKVASGLGVNWNQVPGSGTPADCAASFSLAPGAECNLSLAFTPQSAGLLTDVLVLSDNTLNVTTPANYTQSLPLRGTGLLTPPVLQVSPATMNFGSVPYPGGSATQTLAVTNISGGTLTFDPSSNGRGAVITGNTCGTSIAAGKSCALQVEFKPVQFGPNTNTLTLETSKGVGATVPVRGTAGGVGSATAVLDFGTVTGRGNTKTLPLTVTNNGVPGTVTVATATGATTFHVIANGCASGITASNSCTIYVEYAPVQQITQTGYLKLIPSAGPVQIIAMTGTLTP